MRLLVSRRKPRSKPPSLRPLATFVVSVAAVVLTATAAGAATSMSDGFEGFSVGEVWPDGTTHGAWRAVYNGYGTNSIAVDGSKVLAQRPKASTRPGETHACMVTSVASFGDLDFTTRARTVKQLRSGTPNPWEVAWVVWHHKDDTHFYYLTLKPNGWELGKADPAYPGAQRFLATGSSPTFPVGPWHTFRVRQVGKTITVWGNGTQLASFTDNERPYLTGAVGLYNEDAEVHFDDVRVTSLS